jgi:transcription antitermination factor NusA-like protein
VVVGAELQIRLLERELLGKEIMVVRQQRPLLQMVVAAVAGHQPVAVLHLVLLLAPVVRERPLRLLDHLLHMLVVVAVEALHLAPGEREALVAAAPVAELVLERLEQQIRVVEAVEADLEIILAALAVQA